jgi:hypothetical protein
MYPKAPTNLGHCYAFRGEFAHVIALSARCWRSPLVSALTLGLGNALALALKHHLPLKLANCA